MSEKQLRIAAARLRVLRGWDLAGQLVTTSRCSPLARLITLYLICSYLRTIKDDDIFLVLDHDKTPY